MRLYKSAALPLVLLMSACGGGSESGDNKAESTSTSQLDLTSYQNLPVRYMEPGDIRTYQTATGEQIEVAVSKASASVDYDFEMTENRPWDERIRRFGFRAGKIFLLRMERDGEAIDFESQVASGCADGIPVVFNGTDSDFSQRVTIEPSCGGNSIRSQTEITISGILNAGHLEMSMRTLSDEVDYRSSYIADGETGAVSLDENGETANLVRTVNALGGG